MNHKLSQPTTTPGPAAANAQLLLPYFAPYAAYVLIANVAASLPDELDYAIRIVVTGAMLVVFRRHYRPLLGPRSTSGSVLTGVLAGLVGVGLWIALLLPFQDAQAGDPFSPSAFALRLLAAVLVVPFAEELLCRRFILGVVTQWQQARRAGIRDALGEVLDRRSVQKLEPGAATLLAVLIASAAFMLGHAPAQYPAAFSFGVLMAALWIVRRDLLTPLVAHAVTNLVLYIYVFSTGSWGLW